MKKVSKEYILNYFIFKDSYYNNILFLLNNTNFNELNEYETYFTINYNDMKYIFLKKGFENDNLIYYYNNPEIHIFKDDIKSFVNLVNNYML